MTRTESDDIRSLISLLEFKSIAKMDADGLAMLHNHLKNRLNLKRLKCSKASLQTLLGELKEKAAKEDTRIKLKPNFISNNVDATEDTAPCVPIPKKRRNTQKTSEKKSARKRQTHGRKQA